MNVEASLRDLVVFRWVVVSGCFIAAGVGLVQQIPWLVAAGICIGIGEFLESSYYIGVIRWGQRQGCPPKLRGADRVT